ncbi:permease-like cell division protein FtsX [Aliiglaciecola sp. CAU 1673]|uniref:permease-like cell division protein FtsX n=1 Tax=Aliiglaciecola sp. CAU 1673 TaxID=3032595 RepID=UPI0023DAED12|nr:permease-like cell division protein FtsX [Aliiglaciecola sp. CAU 1673]MDF2177820.1 permease-like cell division protein FtsX [Aliiglaciecola sp. CAU 1673]
MSLLFKGRSQGAVRSQISPVQRLLMFFISHVRQALASLGELWRSPGSSLMTIAVLGLSITLPSALYILLKNTERVSAGWEQASEITLFLHQSTSEGDIQQLMTRLKLWPEVDELVHIDKAQALQEFKQLSGFGDALNYLDSNPLPHVILVKPNKRHTSPTAAGMLLDKLRKEREVEVGQIDIQWLERLHGIVSIAKEMVSVVALLLFLAVALIIGNTIRLNILSRRDEILVMKLVGATDAFIQRPFLYTGFWYGFLGGLLAWITVALLLWWLSDSITRVASLYQVEFQVQGLHGQALLLMLALSIFLGLAGSLLSVHKHIRAIEPK